VWKDGWYVVPWYVMFRDVDTFGHVNNAVFFSYFEHARTRYWLELHGQSDIHQVTFIVARAECDFKAQIELEPLDLLVRIGEMRGSSFDFINEIRKADGTVAATGKVVAVLYDWETQSKVTITDELRRKVRAFQQEE
jgi:acyl-CoA thioester hydrolase